MIAVVDCVVSCDMDTVSNFRRQCNGIMCPAFVSITANSKRLSTR